VQLRQEETAELLQVSRLPVREALWILTEQKLLEYRRNRGYFVAKRAKDDIAQLHRMLVLLEPELLQTARWPTPEEVVQLKALNENMRGLIYSDEIGRFIELNYTFHFTIFGLSPSTVILAEVERLWTMVDANTASALSIAEGRRRSVDEHSAIVKALERRSVSSVLRASEVHRESTYAGGRSVAGRA